MSDHEDYELARRLRRAAGETPDVYIAYDHVLDRIVTIRRRRRTAVASAAGVAVIVVGGSFVFGLQNPDRTLQTAGPSTEVSAPVTVSTVGGYEPAVATTTTELVVPATEPVESTVAPLDTAPVPTEAVVVEPLDTVASTLAPAPPPPAPVTTNKPKPPKPPKPPATSPPVAPPTTAAPVTVAPTEPPPESTAPAATEPPPTTPPTTPATEPPIPVPPQVVTDQGESKGNTVGVALQNGQLSWLYVVPAPGFVETERETTGRRLRITFESATETAHITVTADGGTIKFQSDVRTIQPISV